MMKRVIGSCMLLAFAAAIAGCEAQAKVGDTDNDSTRMNRYERKTTTVREPDGDVHTKTEIRTDR